MKVKSMDYDGLRQKSVWGGRKPIARYWCEMIGGEWEIPFTDCVVDLYVYGLDRLEPEFRVDAIIIDDVEINEEDDVETYEEIVEALSDAYPSILTY